MFCKNCGNKIEDNVKFCGKCGAEVQETTSVTAPEQTLGKSTDIAGKQQSVSTPATAAPAAKGNKKIFIAAAVIVILVLVVAIAFSCSQNKSSEDSVSKEELFGNRFDDDEASEDFAKGIYNPKDGEHRFETIMEEIQNNKQITISNSEKRNLYYAKDENIMSNVYLGINYSLPKLKTDDSVWETQKYFTAYTIECKEPDVSDGKIMRVFINPEQKIYTNIIGIMGSDDTEYLDGQTGKIRFLIDPSDYDCEVPDILSPDKWTFIDSTTDEINGSEYYIEQYSVTIDGTEHSYNIAFDGNGDIVYMGSSALNKVYHVNGYDTPGEWINGNYVKGEDYELTVIYDEDGNVTFEGSDDVIAAHKEDALQSIEKGYSLCENDKELDALSFINIGREAHVVYGQYMPISIKPTFDTDRFDITTYEYVPELYDFLDRSDKEAVHAIDEELTGWF